MIMTTQFARASYQEIIDLHTEEDTVSVIGIHTPQGDTPRKMFGGFFDQFKKFKYLGCSVSLVPAARLPADPSQVSYEAGEQYIDPRDMLNPLMFHGCHGNDMGVILNRFYNTNSIADQPQTDSTFYYADSITDITDGDHISGLQLEDLYYKALTDNTWKKAHPQRGFKKGGLRPLVYSMATNMQFSGGDSIGMDGFGIPEDTVDDVSTSGQSVTATFPVSQNGRRFFTPRLTGLGWLDTRNVLTIATTVTGSTADIRAMLGSAALAQQDASEADLPLVYMGMILLPPAYKTEQYFRMIVNHHFAFKDFRGISFSNNLVEPPAYNQLNDPNDRYYPGEGGSVDPPTPDPPGPEPPIGGAEYGFITAGTAASLPSGSQFFLRAVPAGTDTQTAIQVNLLNTQQSSAPISISTDANKGYLISTGDTGESAIGVYADVDGVYQSIKFDSSVVSNYSVSWSKFAVLNGVPYVYTTSANWVEVQLVEGKTIADLFSVTVSTGNSDLKDDIENATSVTWEVL